jgi:putative glutamine amidotransferase
MRPVIGITCSRVVGGAWGLYSPGHLMDYVFSEYSEAVLAAGGTPLIVPAAQNGESIQEILKVVSGIILTGGPDIHPRFYGEQPLDGLGEIDEALDLMEVAVAKAAVAKDLPILAICRGIQVLNVSQGGSLYQDLRTQVSGCISHGQKADKAVLTHTVRIERESRLFAILGGEEIWVNSKHHQAVKTAATNLTVSARATDGIIEAVEHPEKRFVLGVQWHPEGVWRHDPSSRKLFQALIEAAST